MTPPIITNSICSIQVKLEGDINQGVAYYKKALYYNWHYADAMYNLGVAYGEMLKFDMVIENKTYGPIRYILFQTYPFHRAILGLCSMFMPVLV